MKTQKQPGQPARAKKSRPVRREVGSGVGVRLLVMVAVVAAVIFGVAIFFKVNRIEVQGNTLYSAQEIIDASQIEKGENLLTLNKPAVVGNVRAALPYVESVSIARSMPDTVIIQVKESDLAFAARTDTNTIWLINGVGKALEKIDDTAIEEYPQILGLTLNNPTSGAAVTATSPGSLSAALAVIGALDGTGILDHVASINVEKEFDIVLQYDDRYEILLGGTDELEYKINYLTVILDSLSEFQAGTIDLSFAQSDEARFYAKE